MKHVYVSTCHVKHRETLWNTALVWKWFQHVSTKWFAINAIDCLWLQWRNVFFFADACGCPLGVCWSLQCCQGLCFQRLRISQEPAMSRTQVTETYRHEKVPKGNCFLAKIGYRLKEVGVQTWSEFRQLNLFGQMDGAKCGDLQRSRC